MLAPDHLRKRPRPIHHLEQALLCLGEAGDDLTWADVFTSVALIGVSGSGKTSGVLCTLVAAAHRAGASIVHVATKPHEPELWQTLARRCGRTDVRMLRLGEDTSPKELFVHHMAGPNGAGGSSAIDAAILRERDSNSGWTSAADGILEERLYFCQVPGTRGDVVALLSSSGQQRGQMRYSAYGVPFGMPAGDLDADGDCDFGDLNQIASWISTSTYDVRADMDLDGDVDATDQSILSSLSYGTTLGRGKLAPGPASSAGGAGVRRGYAGYEHDGVIFTVAHVRNRALLTELGRWTRRDPLGYLDGMNLYEYARSRPLVGNDPMGLEWCGLDPPPPGYCPPGQCPNLRPNGCFRCGPCGSLCGAPNSLGAGEEGCPGGKRPEPVDYIISPLLCWFWLLQNEDLTWLLELPDCPCTLAPGGTNPDPSIWTDPGTSPDMGIFHPGASKCMRSLQPSPGGHGQQCCFNSSGNLINRGNGAGTPDHVSPALSVPRHFRDDVAPWIWCGSGGAMWRYHQARPPNRGRDQISGMSCTEVWS